MNQSLKNLYANEGIKGGSPVAFTNYYGNYLEWPS